MKNNYYEGPFISIELRGYRNNDQIAQKFHESLVGKSDYIESNVILNKDPDYTTGKEQTGLYLCVNDMDDYRGIVDTITNVLKSIHENND